MEYKNILDKLNSNDFFDSMDEEGLESFRSLYLDYLSRTTKDDNLKTGRKYTPNELKDLYDMCNKHLKRIEINLNKYGV